MRSLGSFIALALVLGVACGGATAPTSPSPSVGASTAASATPVAPIAVKVAYTNLTGDSLPVWTAMDAGIFAKNGLTVDLQSINGGAQGMAALLSSGVEIVGVGGAEALSATASGGKVTATAVLTPVFPYFLMAAPEIKTVQDLKGKKIGISNPGGSSDIATRKALKAIGLDPDKDVTLIALSSHAQRTAALFAGSIQAAVDDPPNTAELIDKGFHSVYDLAGQKLATAQTAIVVQSAFLTSKKEAMQRFIDSIVEANAWMKKNKAQTVTIMKKYFNAAAGAKGYEEAVDFYAGEALAALPYPKPELFAAAQETLGATNAAVKSIDVKTMVDESFVKSAADRGVDKR
ncbi:MAG: ABC transporter substrate-binding protein [Chloroflexi bacterium]|nr:MAG: ABC transporter substrate-binding protein [Chloroflexota bacterium]